MTQHLVVVGGSRGLGKAFAEMATRQGKNVTVIAKSAAPVPREGYYAFDLSQTDQISSLLETIRRERGEIDGIALFQRFRANRDDWDEEIRISLSATRLIIEQSAPLFAAEGLKSIVLTSSVNALYISRQLPASYHIAKAGLCQLARYYACQLGEKGIRVNAVCPGTFVKPESEDYYRANPAVASRLAKASPLNRMGTYQDVANAIFFLLSENSAFITGQSLMVDGGTSLLWQEHVQS